jgi:hypothetical protein
MATRFGLFVSIASVLYSHTLNVVFAYLEMLYYVWRHLVNHEGLEHRLVHCPRDIAMVDYRDLEKENVLEVEDFSHHIPILDCRLHSTQGGPLVWFLPVDKIVP